MEPLLIDSHTHLDFEVFDTDRDEVILRAMQAGVTRLLTVGAGGGGGSTGLRSAYRAVLLAEKHPGVFASVGVHPHDASADFNGDELETLSRHPKVIAIGETGLDYFRNSAPVEDQRRVFRSQIELALKAKKPLIIHSREAGEECLATLTELGAEAVGGVFHCFSESAGFAVALAKLNFKVSFPGTLTFKKADALRSVAAAIPLTQILVETDAPYMAPEPFRGKRCESSFVTEVARCLSHIKGITYEECCSQLTKNTLSLFPQFANALPISSASISM
jgi:TatD DNase family protein